MVPTAIQCLVFVFFSMSIIRVNSLTCQGISQYAQCSLNSACGCMHMPGAIEAGICGFTHLACSGFVPCASSNNVCEPGYICVYHPVCYTLPICYPISMAGEPFCPTITMTNTTTQPTLITTTTSATSTTSQPDKISLKWKQNAITVAGGNGLGQELNQLYHPKGVFLDKNNNMFLIDYYNHRIVEWKYNAKEGQIIAGGNGAGNQMDQLNYPSVVIVDQNTQSIIIADQGNGRVIRWLNQTQQILIHNIDCYGLAIDKYGFLYVSDAEKNEVRRWKMGEYDSEGIVVAGGNGKGNKLNQFDFPTFLFVDDEQSVYVTDLYNHRVMKWRKDAKEGTIVAGGNGQGGNLNQLAAPQVVILDDLGQIYVADSWNDRIMRWCEGKEEGEIVVGGNGQGNQSNQFFLPMGLSFDDERNLYVADHYNHRIQKFEIIL
ncbi:unnamed protein product [Adineta steineri]|uniref:NHL repeat containing protein n=2 Tax=Adineta steineri TaxID=433720 RepID=A0A814F3D0_9BILA|nr:unnamed protein product [Adineta steineri]